MHDDWYPAVRHAYFEAGALRQLCDLNSRHTQNREARIISLCARHLHAGLCVEVEFWHLHFKFSHFCNDRLCAQKLMNLVALSIEAGSKKGNGGTPAPSKWGDLQPCCCFLKNRPNGSPVLRQTHVLIKVYPFFVALKGHQQKNHPFGGPPKKKTHPLKPV